MDSQGLIETLYEHQEESNQQPMSAYMRDQFPFLGIKSPLRRQLVRPYFSEEKKRMKEMPTDEQAVDWDFVYTCWKKNEREFQYVATDYLKEFQKYLVEEDLDHLKRLVTEKPWWDTVDALAKTVGYVIRKYKLEKEIIEWSQDSNFWLRRIAILHQLLMKEAMNEALLVEIIQHNLKSQEFFINKAIGWALRDYSKSKPEFVRKLIADFHDGLSPLSIREASKYL